MSEDLTVFLAIYIIAFLIGFPNTVLAFCLCIRKIHSKPIPIDIFMLNLAASDLVFLTFLPLKMKEDADNMVWKMPEALCRFSVLMFFLPLYSSSLFLAAISAERYVCAAFPVRYKSPKRIVYTTVICVVTWVIIAVASVFAYKAAFLDSNEADNTTNNHSLKGPQSCYINFTSKQLTELLPVRFGIAVGFFLLPLLICSFCYISLIRILMKCPIFKRQRKLRVVGLVVGTLLVFAISFAPCEYHTALCDLVSGYLLKLISLDKICSVALHNLCWSDAR